MAGFFNHANRTLVNGGTFVVVNNSRDSGFDHLRRMAVPAAMHNSGEVERSPCHKNSQVAVCKRLMNWLVANENKKRLMVWVYGDSNTGKSTITQTLAMWCFQEGYLLGSFFFTKTDPQRSTYKYFAATLAYQVATVVPALKERISAAVEHDPLIFDKSLETQVNALIIDPINSLCSITAGIVPHVILIDGLDECLGWKKQCYVLEALSAAIPRCKIPLRVLIASRPETEIKLAFNSYPLQSFSTKFTLDNSFQSGADKLRFPDPLEEIETRHQVNANISAVNPGVKKVGKCFIVLTMILKTWNIGINQYYSSRFSFNPRRIEETTLPIAANSPRSQWGETLTGTRSISTIVLTSSISLITVSIALLQIEHVQVGANKWLRGYAASSLSFGVTGLMAFILFKSHKRTFESGSIC